MFMCLCHGLSQCAFGCIANAVINLRASNVIVDLRSIFPGVIHITVACSWKTMHLCRTYDHGRRARAAAPQPTSLIDGFFAPSTMFLVCSSIVRCTDRADELSNEDRGGMLVRMHAAASLDHQRACA